MNKSDYDKYYKKGGTYVIPVEVFNELFDELEELKKNQRLTPEERNHLHLELDEIVESLQNQLQQKENIIKEVREYILTHKLYCFKYDEEELFEITTDKKAKDELLEILDKVSDEQWKRFGKM